ncbi:lysine--tRNA ligase [Govanella unica]|uniref:Lysine--tRNA ligase n=1 Tax=Govanella unica TaxID=2975056 RepID=A0A9X3TZH5_9PROT|nr:lysine--tRNA ligase [Govania unica]MDA5194609.1 lysine--tRNA ligase [Govania unica]
MSSDRDLGLESNAWPFQEALKLVERVKKTGKESVLFETGYGPSGLPHIGTFGEVARTTMVRKAFSLLSDLPTRLIAFSDDMDGLRKVPDNVPNKDMLQQFLNRPLTQVPDPFGTHESFAHHNNARLREFLDRFGFEYEFLSATECYKSGRFDATLLKVLEHYDAVMNVILPTLRDERRRTYSPFLPVSPITGHVLQVPVLERNLEAGTIVYEEPDGTRMEVPVTGGHCKLQWKADWAMRWVALGVDYEMAGKDLIDSVTLSGKICRALGATPPEGFNYELFLDEKGEKISKSRGNGLTIEEWLRYASDESLSLYMFQSPRKAKRLYFDVIPKAVDEYFSFLESYPGQEPKQQLANPVWHVHSGDVPDAKMPVSFNLLLNLVGAAQTGDKDVLWGFISQYAPDATPATHPQLDQSVGYAIAYYEDFVKPTKSYRLADDAEKLALGLLLDKISALPANAGGEAIQNEVYAVGKEQGYENLRDWFKALYEILLGQPQGPRMGSFFALYGLQNSKALLQKAIAGEAL